MKKRKYTCVVKRGSLRSIESTMVFKEEGSLKINQPRGGSEEEVEIVPER